MVSNKGECTSLVGQDSSGRRIEFKSEYSK